MRKMKVLVVLVAMVCCVGFAGNVWAEEESAHSLSATLTFTTDWVWRGVSLSSENPAIQGSIDYAHACGFYAGIWGTNWNDPASDSSIEIDYYTGFANAIAGIDYDLMVILYSYPGANDDDPVNNVDAEYDYFEFHIGLGYGLNLPLEPYIGVNYDYSPDYFGEDGDGHHYTGTIAFSLPHDFGIDTLYGYQDVEGDKLSGGVGWDYAYWEVGLTKSLLGFDFDLRYIDTNNDGEDLFGGIATERVVFSLSRSF